ncbi:MAG: hypothetical protein KGL39_23780 [Patescibacteria group bacterium]|nr:hypothetical protein [Patescibacteria group bacterium]
MSTEAVDFVFRTMAATYGAEWDRSVGLAPIADVKTVWGDVIEPYCQNNDSKRAIMWALKNLPERAPNARQFAALLRLSPEVEKPRLEAPRADPERVKAELAKLGAAKTKATTNPVDHKAWARRIISRHEAGGKVRPISLRFAREALQ